MVQLLHKMKIRAVGTSDVVNKMMMMIEGKRIQDTTTLRGA